MTRLLVLGALALTALLWNCGGQEKKVVNGQVDPMPVIPDSIRNKPKLPLEMNSWRLLTYTKDGIEQKMEGGDSVSVTINFQYGKATGSSGCNDFNVDCAIDSTGAIAFSDNLTHSSRRCLSLMAQEQFIQQTLIKVKSYTISPDRRRLELDAGDVKFLYVGVISGQEDNKAPKVKVQ